MSKKKQSPKTKIEREPLHLIEPGGQITYERLNGIFSMRFSIYTEYQIIWDPELVSWLPGQTIEMLVPAEIADYEPLLQPNDMGTIVEVRPKPHVIMVKWDKGRTTGVLPGSDIFRLCEPGTGF